MSDEQSIDSTQEELEQKEAIQKEEECSKCEEYLMGWKRALADYDNLKKDLVRERVEIRARAREDLGQQLIAVLDNFDQAAKFQPQEVSKEVQTWLTGLMYVRVQLETVLQELGLEPFGEAGTLFNAHLHEAAAQRSEPEKSDQEILEVFQRGWKMGDKIVRPAKVVINNLHT
ncbi:TPA: nucleotide exchange factor GrpE [Candidatus Uhrbacteria bacterium]|nr:nucleotide exchange factor GrpE [Candidatus Uhrbacteria bacterium]